MYSLDNAHLFNLLCIPPFDDSDTTLGSVYSEALKYCMDRRAMLIVDPPADWNNKNKAKKPYPGFSITDDHKNAAIFFPRFMWVDAEQHRTFVPCGAVAGVIARTDSQRGVWKAPAGIEASLLGVSELIVKLTDLEIGELNSLGVNCLRSLSTSGFVVWGSRTMRGADRLADQWKYLAVRRTALFIEESIFRGTQWAVFEPNDEPLWAQIRLNVGAFMHDLFRKDAFQASTPKEAYLVKCDHETTTQDDINKGIVNIIVGFAPLNPAEFVILQIKQLTAQTEAGGE